jgi:hypothetical protein
VDPVHRNVPAARPGRASPQRGGQTREVGRRRGGREGRVYRRGNENSWEKLMRDGNDGDGQMAIADGAVGGFWVPLLGCCPCYCSTKGHE